MQRYLNTARFSVPMLIDTLFTAAPVSLSSPVQTLLGLLPVKLCHKGDISYLNRHLVFTE